MPKAVDIEQELAKLDFLHGRNTETTPAQEDTAFARLTQYRDGGVFAGGFSGESPWERHQTDSPLTGRREDRTGIRILMTTNKNSVQPLTHMSEAINARKSPGPTSALWLRPIRVPA